MYRGANIKDVQKGAKPGEKERMYQIFLSDKSPYPYYHDSFKA